MPEISVGPPETPPNGQKFLTRKAFLDSKFWTKFYSQNRLEVKIGQKNTPWRLKKLFNVYFHCSDNFEWCRNFYGSRRLFENFDLWVKNFKKWPYLQNGQNHHFSTFDDFFFHFGQTGPSWPHLRNFASQKFLQAKGVPPESWYFGLKMCIIQLKQSGRNFCGRSEISAKMETPKTSLKHILVSWKSMHYQRT